LRILGIGAQTFFDQSFGTSIKTVVECGLRALRVERSNLGKTFGSARIARLALERFLEKIDGVVATGKSSFSP